MKYLLAIFAATIMLAVLETCGEKPERAAFTVRPVQPDTLVLFWQLHATHEDSSAMVFFDDKRFVLYDDYGNSLEAKSNGKCWEVESELPVEVKSKQRDRKSSLEPHMNCPTASRWIIAREWRGPTRNCAKHFRM